MLKLSVEEVERFHPIYLPPIFLLNYIKSCETLKYYCPHFIDTELSQIY